MTVERICNRPTKGAARRSAAPHEHEQVTVVVGATQQVSSVRCVRFVSLAGLQQRGFALGRQANRRACWRSS